MAIYKKSPNPDNVFADGNVESASTKNKTCSQMAIYKKGPNLSNVFADGNAQNASAWA